MFSMDKKKFLYWWLLTTLAVVWMVSVTTAANPWLLISEDILLSENEQVEVLSRVPNENINLQWNRYDDSYSPEKLKITTDELIAIRDSITCSEEEINWFINFNQKFAVLDKYTKENFEHWRIDLFNEYAEPITWAKFDWINQAYSILCACWLNSKVSVVNYNYYKEIQNTLDEYSCWKKQPDYEFAQRILKNIYIWVKQWVIYTEKQPEKTNKDKLAKIDDKHYHDHDNADKKKRKNLS